MKTLKTVKDKCLEKLLDTDEEPFVVCQYIDMTD